MIIALIFVFGLLGLVFVGGVVLGRCAAKKKELIRLREELKAEGLLTEESEKELNHLIKSCPYPF